MAVGRLRDMVPKNNAEERNTRFTPNVTNQNNNNKKKNCHSLNLSSLNPPPSTQSYCIAKNPLSDSPSRRAPATTVVDGGSKIGATVKAAIELD